jgi:hypothetical protein
MSSAARLNAREHSVEADHQSAARRFADRLQTGITDRLGSGIDDCLPAGFLIDFTPELRSPLSGFLSWATTKLFTTPRAKCGDPSLFSIRAAIIPSFTGDLQRLIL